LSSPASGTAEQQKPAKNADFLQPNGVPCGIPYEITKKGEITMKRIIPIALVFLLAVAMAFGCSGKAAAPENGVYYSSQAKADYAYDEPEAPMEMDTAYGYEGNTAAPASNLSTALSNRKIIRNADMSVETLVFDTFVEQLTGSVEGFGGYIESSSVGTRSYRSDHPLRYARYTVRIPADRLDEFLNTVSGLGNVTSVSTGLRDVTTNYVDSEKHLEALRTEQTALLEILSKATTVEDIITVQDRLTYVSYEIESYEAILRTYDDQIALSSVNLTVNEVEKETPVEKETFGQEVSRRFKESLSDIGDSCKNCAAGFLGNSPMIIVTLLILGLIALVVILIIKGVRKHYAKKRAKAQKPAAPAPAEKPNGENK
jgi:hypothetical protein